MMWHENITGTIGKTPLVQLRSITADCPCTVLAKLEYFNPGGSVKDRIGVAMIEEAEQNGLLGPGGTIVEGTSGNTGAALAMTAVTRGYRCIFTTTDKQSQEKLDVLRALGAEVIVCPTNVAPEDPRSYYSVAQRLAEEIPGAVYLNQYDNPANRAAHYETTGPEIWEGTDGRITHYVGGAGTGGTLSGVSRYLKERNPNVQVIGVDPYGSIYHGYFHTGKVDPGDIYPYLTEGVGEDLLAANMDFDVLDDFVQVTDREAMQMARRLAAEEGLFCGQSSGMALAGALSWIEAHAGQLSSDDVFVLLLPDSGFRYLSKTFNDNWMRNHGFLSSMPEVTVDRVLDARNGNDELAFALPEDTLGSVIGVMAERGISQMPVMQNDELIGSLTESVIIDRLIKDPETRDQPVEGIMDAPFPVVPRSLGLEHLSMYLERGGGAVLVKAEPGETYQIITKSDLIGALAPS
ncbi:MAG: pyridoxal-phosphate dependent enzyme [Bacteroidetes bacterium SB0662_bin_6]|nr:pyridoxal-phosphate dependent enzyme [Bacteroidetes bacterium SB0668_bin_1]MYE05460.1 pyridoxal-phosphate dependent enzyme [Bacteroidetes bacterium SB0662_bin_6]